VGEGGSVSDGRGVHVGVLVIVGGRGVVVGMKAAITRGPSSRKASHVADRPMTTSVATNQKRRWERVSRTGNSTTAGSDWIAVIPSALSSTTASAARMSALPSLSSTTDRGGRGRPHIRQRSAPSGRMLSQRGQRSSAGGRLSCSLMVNQRTIITVAPPRLNRCYGALIIPVPQ
jgi:hypothetical protein